jgi:hypothetical protein
MSETQQEASFGLVFAGEKPLHVCLTGLLQGNQNNRQLGAVRIVFGLSYIVSTFLSSFVFPVSKTILS